MATRLEGRMLRLRMVMIAALVSFMLLFVGQAGTAAEGPQKPLTNEDIVAMVQGGLPTEVIVEVDYA